MEKLIKGVEEFQKKEVAADPDFFSALAQGQSPDTLFITCSDSRINPNLVTQTKPGELFIVRNAGNLVPPHGASAGGEVATIEYAVVALKVKDIIVCGHTDCGAMRALDKTPEELSGLPTVAAWLRHADTTRAVVKACCDHLEGDERHLATVEANVKVQIEHLKSLPSVAAALAKGELRLHGWVYHLQDASMTAFNPTTGAFEAIRPGVVPQAAVGQPIFAGRVPATIAAQA